MKKWHLQKMAHWPLATRGDPEGAKWIEQGEADGVHLLALYPLHIFLSSRSHVPKDLNSTPVPRGLEDTLRERT